MTLETTATHRSACFPFRNSLREAIAEDGDDDNDNDDDGDDERIAIVENKRSSGC